MWRSSLGLLLLVAACSEGGSREAVVARIDTTATGRIQVENTGVSAWTSETAWRLEENLRVGSVVDPSSEAEQFSSVRDLVSDSRGRIYVLDGQAQEVRVFLADGSFSHTIGRLGEGPGEFQFASTLTIGPGDTLTVLDDGMMRYSIFSPDGGFVESHARSIVGHGPPLQARLRDGSYLDWGMAFPDGRLGPRALYYPIMYAEDLTVGDTFPPIQHTQDMVESGRMPLTAFGSFPVVSPNAEGVIWFAQADRYRIYRRTLEGDTTLVFSLPVDPVPLVEEDREEVRERWAHRSDILSEQLDALPEFKPVVYGIVPDNEGHILVFLDVAGLTSGTAVDVFQESGEYLGRLSLPEAVELRSGRQPIVHVSRENLYLVVRDEMDVPHISRLELLKEQ